LRFVSGIFYNSLSASTAKNKRKRTRKEENKHLLIDKLVALKETRRKGSCGKSILVTKQA